MQSHGSSPTMSRSSRLLWAARQVRRQCRHLDVRLDLVAMALGEHLPVLERTPDEVVAEREHVAVLLHLLDHVAHGAPQLPTRSRNRWGDRTTILRPVLVFRTSQTTRTRSRP